MKYVWLQNLINQHQLHYNLENLNFDCKCQFQHRNLNCNLFKFHYKFQFRKIENQFQNWIKNFQHRGSSLIWLRNASFHNTINYKNFNCAKLKTNSKIQLKTFSICNFHSSGQWVIGMQVSIIRSWSASDIFHLFG